MANFSFQEIGVTVTDYPRSSSSASRKTSGRPCSFLYLVGLGCLDPENYLRRRLASGLILFRRTGRWRLPDWAEPMFESRGRFDLTKNPEE